MEYQLKQPTEVPPLLHPSKRINPQELELVPLEAEIRYLTNMKMYCKYFMERLQEC